ncbi:MAG: type II secretion system protein GspK [Thiohalocapsa sp.]
MSFSYPTRQTGIALVLVLWIISLLTVMALGLTTTQRTESALTQNQLDGARFRATAEAAINLTVLNLLSTPLDTESAGNVWVPDGMPRTLIFDRAKLSITLYNEGSRLDLNTATSEQLATLIELAQGEAGLDQGQYDALADAIVDWRDADDLTQLNGAEDGDYEAAGLPYGARDEPLQSVDELQQVLGMTRALYQRLAPHVSVDNDSGGVDEQFASAPVLAALQGLSLEEAQRFVDERNAPVLPGAEQTAAVSRGGPLYRIRVSMAGADGIGRTMEALVLMQPGDTPPFEVRWRRYGLMQQPIGISPPDGAE